MTETKETINQVTEETESTRKLKEGFGFFGLSAFLYACFYTVCMFRNPSGVTFPFFIAGSLLYFCFCIAKLEISLKKGSVFYMVAMVLLAVSTFCTDDSRIITMNKWGIFLLMMSLLLDQVYDTSRWQLGQYMKAILCVIFGGTSRVARIFQDGNRYRKAKDKQKTGKLLYVILGLVIAVPFVLITGGLLVSADAVFRDMAWRVLRDINIVDGLQIFAMTGGMLLGVYSILAYLCEKTMKEEPVDKRKGEPILAITVTSLLTVMYMVFSGIQIVYLFFGKMQLPEGYTYAGYAREGFFQLLAVSVLNLIIVLACMAFFRENIILKIVLALMSACTFIMILSSGLRMIVYIQYYYLTFLRIFVLWALVVLSLLFIGIMLGIFRKRFPLFRYSCVAVTCCYLVLAFCHPDFWIAKVNTANTEYSVPQTQGFFRGEPYEDYHYLATLNGDAAPVLLPWMKEYREEMGLEVTDGVMNNQGKAAGWLSRYVQETGRRNEEYDNLLQFNVSRHVAKLQTEAFMEYMEE